LTVSGVDSTNFLRKPLRHDRMIVVNELRRAFSSWSDRLIAASVVLIALATLHASLADRPWLVAASAVAGLSAIAGASAARLLHRRLAFHTDEGALADAALDPRARRRYLVAFHALGLGVLGVATLAARPSLLALGLAAYLAGAALGHLASLAAGGLALRRPTAGRAMRAQLRRPIAGALAAIGLLLLVLALRGLDTPPRTALVGAATVIAVLGMTSLDDSAIRFMTLSGYRAPRILGLAARGPLAFLAIGLPALLAAANPLLAGIVTLVTLAGLALMAARILAYRSHGKRAADTLVGICAAAACLTGLAAPMLLPIVMIAIFWHLSRRSAPATWLLA